MYLLALSVSDKIDIISIIVSSTLAIVSLLISIQALKQSHKSIRLAEKSIEEANRPYIAIYSRMTSFQSTAYYIVVKNFGHTGATITQFECDHDLAKYSYHPSHVPFKYFVGTFIAPGQSFVCNVNPIQLFSDVEQLHFSVGYETETNKYFNSFVINLKADADILHVRPNTKGKELNIIARTLQDLVEQFL